MYSQLHAYAYNKNCHNIQWSALTATPSPKAEPIFRQNAPHVHDGLETVDGSTHQSMVEQEVCEGTSQAMGERKTRMVQPPSKKDAKTVNSESDYNRSKVEPHAREVEKSVPW